MNAFDGQSSCFVITPAGNLLFSATDQYSQSSNLLDWARPDSLVQRRRRHRRHPLRHRRRSKRHHAVLHRHRPVLPHLHARRVPGLGDGRRGPEQRGQRQHVGGAAAHHRNRVGGAVRACRAGGGHPGAARAPRARPAGPGGEVPRAAVQRAVGQHRQHLHHVQPQWRLGRLRKPEHDAHPGHPPPPTSPRTCATSTARWSRDR